MARPSLFDSRPPRLDALERHLGPIALACPEEDGALLGVALAATLAMPAFASLSIREAVTATGWVPGILQGPARGSR